MAKSNLPRPCTRCVAAVAAGEQETVYLEWLPCAVCGEPTCDSGHGHMYRTGWEHEECHESPDFSRIEE